MIKVKVLAVTSPCHCEADFSQPKQSRWTCWGWELKRGVYPFEFAQDRAERPRGLGLRRDSLRRQVKLLLLLIRREEFLEQHYLSFGLESS